MKGKIQTALQLLFPPRCVACGVMVESDFGLCAACWAEVEFLGSEVCNTCGRPMAGGDAQAGVVCDECLVETPPWSKGRSAFRYTAAGRDLVLALKHGDRTDISLPAAKWLAQAAKPLLTQDVLIAPVPLHRLRLLKRRYNQAALMSQALAAMLGARYCPDLLLRIGARGSLEGLGVKERYAKLNNAIVPNPKWSTLLGGANVLLVDDVLTSGATLKAATRACLHGNAKDVCVVTLARVAKGT
ncbi:double zinc ribbon domain-containing protein [Shimia sp.]|uniref:double zinc ribbon domain-containing protein n=1 Tax=Shimia sp. TaxID=1954381 RepID=UPI003BA8B8D0